MREPIGKRSMWLNQDNRCRRVSPGDVCARVSQGNLTLSPPTCRKPAMGEPIGRCPARHLRVSRSGSEIPSYGGTHQERHLHAVRLERRSGVTRIVAPAELPRLGVPTLLIYRSRRVGVAARAERRPVGVLT